MATIELINLSKQYSQGRETVSGVNLSISDGEFVVLVGPSGCGKTTTLNMIAGLEDITSGEIRISGKKVNELSSKDRDIAMVFQSYALYPHMSVYANLAFPLKLAKKPKNEIKEQVLKVAKQLEIEELLERKPGQLSGGQRQRVAMGRAMVRNPSAFLMDEPLSNLDAKLRGQMRAELLRLHRSNPVTTVYVTHDQTEAMTLGDRIIIMSAGKVEQVGAPAEIYANPETLFVAGFIGTPSMNFLPAKAEGKIVRTPIGDINIQEELSQDLIVGFRPENIILEETINSLKFEGKCEFVEALGSEDIAHFTVKVDKTKFNPELLNRHELFPSKENVPLTIKVPTPRSSTRIKIDQDLYFSVIDSSIYFFDPKSGKNLHLNAI